MRILAVAKLDLHRYPADRGRAIDRQVRKLVERSTLSDLMIKFDYSDRRSWILRIIGCFPLYIQVVIERCEQCIGSAPQPGDSYTAEHLEQHQIEHDRVQQG